MSKYPSTCFDHTISSIAHAQHSGHTEQPKKSSDAGGRDRREPAWTDLSRRITSQWDEKDPFVLSYPVGASFHLNSGLDISFKRRVHLQ